MGWRNLFLASKHSFHGFANEEKSFSRRRERKEAVFATLRFRDEKVDIFGTYTPSPENFRNTSVVGGHKAIPGKTPYILEFRKYRLSREIFSQKGVQLGCTLNIAEKMSFFFDIFKNAEKRVFFDRGSQNRAPEGLGRHFVAYYPRLVFFRRQGVSRMVS